MFWAEVVYLMFLKNRRIAVSLPGRLMAGQRPLEPYVEVRVLPGQLTVERDAKHVPPRPSDLDAC